MQHIGQITTEVIKEFYPPETFYPQFAGGSFGKPSGNGWYQWNGLCPFHDDHRPGSLYIRKEDGAFKCFSCGAKGGDILDFHMQKERLTFTNSLNTLRRAVSCAK